MNKCVFCKQEVYMVGMVHLVDTNKKVVCQKNPSLRPVHKTK